MKLSLALLAASAALVQGEVVPPITSAPIKKHPDSWVDTSVAPPVFKDDVIVAPNTGIATTSGSQAQICSPDHKFIKADKLVDEDGNFEVHDQMFHPNIEWVPVKPEKWGFDGTVKSNNHPLGFRKAAFKTDGSPICLKLPASSAQHKIELMIEYMATTRICVQDIRQSVMNDEVALVRDCDDRGRLNRCFSALSGKYTADGKTAEVIAAEAVANAKDSKEISYPINAPTQSAEFAVAIGCFGPSCRDDKSTNVIYYRIRQSAQSWADKTHVDAVTGKAYPGTNLDYWCMNLGATAKNLVNFKLSGLSKNMENTVPQKYPTDLWSRPQLRPGEGGSQSMNEPNYSGDHNGSAATLVASVASVVLPLMAMLF